MKLKDVEIKPLSELYYEQLESWKQHDIHDYQFFLRTAIVKARKENICEPDARGNNGFHLLLATGDHPSFLETRARLLSTMLKTLGFSDVSDEKSPNVNLTTFRAQDAAASEALYSALTHLNKRKRLPLDLMIEDVQEIKMTMHQALNSIIPLIGAIQTFPISQQKDIYCSRQETREFLFNALNNDPQYQQFKRYFPPQLLQQEKAKENAKEADAFQKNIQLMWDEGWSAEKIVEFITQYLTKLRPKTCPIICAQQSGNNILHLLAMHANQSQAANETFTKLCTDLERVPEENEQKGEPGTQQAQTPYEQALTTRNAKGFTPLDYLAGVHCPGHFKFQNVKPFLLKLSPTHRQNIFSHWASECSHLVTELFMSGTKQDILFFVHSFPLKRVGDLFRDKDLVPKLNSILKERIKEGKIEGPLDVDILFNSQYHYLLKKMFEKLTGSKKNSHFIEKIQNFGKHALDFSSGLVALFPSNYRRIPGYTTYDDLLKKILETQKFLLDHGMKDMVLHNRSEFAKFLEGQRVNGPKHAEIADQLLPYIQARPNHAPPRSATAPVVQEHRQEMTPPPPATSPPPGGAALYISATPQAGSNNGALANGTQRFQFSGMPPRGETRPVNSLDAINFRSNHFASKE